MLYFWYFAKLWYFLNFSGFLHIQSGIDFSSGFNVISFFSSIIVNGHSGMSAVRRTAETEHFGRRVTYV